MVPYISFQKSKETNLPDKNLTGLQKYSMNLPLKIARRYLFAKIPKGFNVFKGVWQVLVTLLALLMVFVTKILFLKKTPVSKKARRYLSGLHFNAINIITSISVAGITIGTAALLLVMSVFNGFEDLISSLFSRFNPDVKIIAAVGKTFEVDTLQLAKIQGLPGVLAVSQTLEEVAFFEYKKSQDFGSVKGVDTFFNKVTGIDSSIYIGDYSLQDDNVDLAILGGGMYHKLSVDLSDPFEVLKIFMAKKEKVSGLEQPFKKRMAYPVGMFRIQQDFDNQYVLVSLNFARELLGAADNEVSALELKLKPGTDFKKTIFDIRQITGEGLVVKDRYQQDEAFLKLMNIEKWMSFAILSLTLVLVAFNMIGSLWMIVLEKKDNIATLKGMGATNGLVRNIFIYEGLLLCLMGLATGFVLAIVLYVLQKYFGLVSIGEGFVVSAYPVALRPFDLLAVAVIVLVIGVIASVPAALRAQRIPALIREE